jgi:ABC-type multidrug transport system fused ATPase/permease subunit
MRFFLLLGIFFYSQIFSADQSLSQKTEQILGSEYSLASPSIIGKREWKELQLDRLITILDRTKTSFGKWGLIQLLHPISDTEELSRRKKIITFLVEHENEMRIFQEQLERIHKLEQSLLAYWDKTDQLNNNIQQFYYSMPFLRELNKSSLALDASSIVEMFNAWKYLLSTLALSGISTEYAKWLYGEQEKFDIWKGLYSGLEVPITQHSPFTYLVKDKETYGYKDYVRAFSYGSWGDRYKILSKGFNFDSTHISLPKIFSSIVPGASTLGAFIGATLPTLVFDYQWGNSILSVGRRIIAMNVSLNNLQKRVSDVTQCLDAIRKLQDLITHRIPALGEYFYDERTNNSFIKKLSIKNFPEKSGYFYSRGYVLTTNLEIFKNRESLVTSLSSIAMLDAYCSIAQLYKEFQNKPLGFVLPEFVEPQKPSLSYRGAWLPLLSEEQAVSNDLILGDEKSGKIIITGPNGGGKSTILKTYGICAVLAQSWCIVSAKKAQQTIFTSIRTNIASREDLQQGLSTGTAAIKIMSELLDDIKDLKSTDRVLVIIDEPYSGMVDDEAAKRIYQFGINISHYPQVLTAIATHTKKPIQLENDTSGIFGNYQVRIEEVKRGVFERLFKIEPGPAQWWFEDEDKRSRFVDWLSISDNFELKYGND